MIDKLKRDLLLSNRKEFVKFIEKEYNFFSYKDFEVIENKKSKLSKLDLEVIKECLNRINSIKSYYDLSKGFPFLAAIISLVFVYLIKDYWPMVFMDSKEDFKKMSILIALLNLGICGALLFVCMLIMRKCQDNNCLLLQFEGVLQDIKEKQEKKLVNDKSNRRIIIKVPYKRNKQRKKA